MVGTANEMMKIPWRMYLLKRSLVGLVLSSIKKLFTNELFAKGLRVDKLNLVKPF